MFQFKADITELERTSCQMKYKFQMSSALRNASPNSLVIMDEFGKGTSEVDGLGILSACLDHFIQQADSPHVFVSTHFHSLPKLLSISPIIKLWVSFDSFAHNLIKYNIFIEIETILGTCILNRYWRNIFYLQ